MTWTFEFSKKSENQFLKLDDKIQSRIKKAVFEKLHVLVVKVKHRGEVYRG
jgi:mRNA-degrading endonuclease RelE of RelBE toxin-antitoxin system